MESETDEKPCKESQLIEKGLPLDWLVRAHSARNMETLVYLYDQRQKWINEDQKLILTILQDYENSGAPPIPENEPPLLHRRRGKVATSPECPKIFIFTCQLLDLIKEEPTIWDKVNCANFGYHQPMRQAWCSISLKLGGWGAMPHVQMLKQLYRRRRDQYNIDHLRLGKPFVYSEKLSFLKNILETAKSDTWSSEISLADHIEACEPKIDYEEELKEAPEFVQRIISEISSRIDQVSAQHSPETLAHYLTKCCNQTVANRERLAVSELFEEPVEQKVPEESKFENT
ncbi:hypothetical protein L5515_000279 [Caenorhabditis briggsae]|uniref:MADF domain-containing protein n=1 Tax=Caenorhabditis briggsae TaxID=6238 RepID=A0AAE9E009_CAEBR|nr:hypothetical protein L5515_000279 [Caenorhabditis briggsae]